MSYGTPADVVEAIRIANHEALLEFWTTAFIAMVAVGATAALTWFAITGVVKFHRNCVRKRRYPLIPLFWVTVAIGGAKFLVSYPRTDPTTAYLTDNGSYVESDTDIVYINFRRLIVPDSAVMYVDRIQRGEDGKAAEGAAWENVFAATFGETPLPLEITYANATNYLWAVYTDWTPGPAVQTNGVWHANWGMDLRKQHIIPLRTAVRLDGETIATPKSKEDSEHEND